MSFTRSSLDVFPVSNFVVKEIPIHHAHTEECNIPLTKKDNSALGRLLRLKNKFERGGVGSVHTTSSTTVPRYSGVPVQTSCMPPGLSGPSPVRSVEAVVLLHEHNHPHVLLLRYTNPNAVGATSVPNQGQNNATTYFYRLPGGTCRHDEDEIPCLLRKLGRRLLAAPKEPKSSHICETLCDNNTPKQQPEVGAAGVSDSLLLGSVDNNTVQCHDISIGVPERPGPKVLYHDGTVVDPSTISLSLRHGPNGNVVTVSDITTLLTNASPNSVACTLHTPIKETRASASLLASRVGNDASPLSAVAGSASPFTGMTSMSMTRHQGRSVDGMYIVLNSPAAKTASQFFRVGEVLSQWYRPTYDRLVYPYRPAHVTMEKERRTLFVVYVDPHTSFYLPSEDPSGDNRGEVGGIHRQSSLIIGGNRMPKGPQNANSIGVKNTDAQTTKSAAETYELVAVPLFDLYQNTAKYGSIIESLPVALSRFAFNFR